MREAVDAAKSAPGDALLPLQLVDGWLGHGWLCFRLRCQAGMFPRQQESFSHVCGPDGQLSVEVLPTSLVQSCLAFGIDKVNSSWPESVQPIG